MLSRPPTSHSLNLLDLKIWLRLLLVLLTEALVFFIDVHDQLLNMVASYLILVKVPRTDAKMKRLIALLLSWTFLEA